MKDSIAKFSLNEVEGLQNDDSRFTNARKFTKIEANIANIAQSAEHCFRKAEVVSSNLTVGSRSRQLCPSVALAKEKAQNKKLYE